jgi:adenosine deaminase
METIPCHAATLATPIEQKAARTFSVTPHASEVTTDAKVLDVTLGMSTDVLQHGFAPMRSQQWDTHIELLQFLADRSR